MLMEVFVIPYAYALPARSNSNKQSIAPGNNYIYYTNYHSAAASTTAVNNNATTLNPILLAELDFPFAELAGAVAPPRCSCSGGTTARSGGRGVNRGRGRASRKHRSEGGDSDRDGIGGAEGAGEDFDEVGGASPGGWDGGLVSVD
ncbi:hypothetical protein K438DRAFT_1988324 [Mycena galopus ATCC 62051]|nr:hypothetical protein K438DRAFT_1988324 [Mycena galopus ATCC 62051]